MDDGLDDLIEDVLNDPSIFSSGGCWGHALSGQPCMASFVPGESHFKTKFCSDCCASGFDIAAARVCALGLSLVERFTNKQGRSLWTRGFRLVNQTLKCSGPRLVIFQDTVPAELVGTVPLPAEWLRSDAAGNQYVRFVVKLGTLCPIATALGVPRSLRPVHGQQSEEQQLQATKRPRDTLDASETPGAGLPSTLGAMRDAKYRCNQLILPRDATEADEASVEDLATVAAVISSENFQTRQREELQMSAAALGALDARGREILHRMYRTSTVTVLGDAVGEDCLRRVMSALRSPQLRTTVHDVTATSELIDRVQLVLSCVSVLDQGVWLELVRNVGAARPIRARALEDSSSVGSLHQYLASLSLRSEAAAPEALRGADSLALVRRTVTDMQRVIDDASAAWQDFGDPVCGQTLLTKELLCYTRWEFESPCGGALPAEGAVGPAALALMNHVQCEYPGMSLLSGSLHSHDNLYEVKATNVMDGLFMRLFTSLTGRHTDRICIRQFVETTETGVQQFLLEWDAERDVPLLGEDGCLKSLVVMTMRLDRASKEWRMQWFERWAMPRWLQAFSGAVVPLINALGTQECAQFVASMRTKSQESAALQC